MDYCILEDILLAHSLLDHTPEGMLLILIDFLEEPQLIIEWGICLITFGFEELQQRIMFLLNYLFLLL